MSHSLMNNPFTYLQMELRILLSLVTISKQAPKGNIETQNTP